MSEVGPSCQVARSWQAVVRPGRAGPRSKSRRRLPHPPTRLAARIVPVLSRRTARGPAPASGPPVERQGLLLEEAGRRLEAEVAPGPRARPPGPAGCARCSPRARGRARRRSRRCRTPRPTATARVDSPTGPPPNRRHSASSTARSSRSSPASSTSNSASAAWAASWSTWPWPCTWAQSRTRRSSRLAMRGVPRERLAISAMPASSASTPSSRAERCRIVMRSAVS